MSEDGLMRDLETNSAQEQDDASCCGNCLFFCEHESEGFVHCLMDERESPKPDDAPCGQWMHKNERNRYIRLSVEMSAEGVRIVMSIDGKERRGLLESILGKLGWFFILLEMIAVVVNVMVEGDQSGFVYLFVGIAAFCLVMEYLLRRRRWNNDQRTRESRRGYEQPERID